MALAARMEIRQGQGLVITPQLQQAIKLLQLSNIELDAFVETELERNPLLARDEGDAEPEVEIASAAADYETHELPDAVAAAELDAPTVYDDASPSERASGDAPTPDAADAGGQIDWSRAGSPLRVRAVRRRLFEHDCSTRDSAPTIGGVFRLRPLFHKWADGGARWFRPGNRDLGANFPQGPGRHCPRHQ